MLSFLVKLDGTGLDVYWHAPTECAVTFGMFKPTSGGRPVRVGIEPFGDAHVLHVPSVEAFRDLVRRGGVSWAGGVVFAAQKAAAAAWEWPQYDLVDGDGDPIGKVDRSPPQISGGLTPAIVSELTNSEIIGLEVAAGKVTEVTKPKPALEIGGL